jgi:SAM-dependent methyltransferase
MGESDRERWDRRWAAGEQGAGESPDWLGDLPEGLLPRTGRVLDVASGSGAVAVWLARRGLDVTAVDVSPVGLQRAARAAAEAGLVLRTRTVDLESDPLPHPDSRADSGPEAGWDVVTCFHYLQRALFPALAAALAPGGRLVCEIATVRNLERNARPPARFLLDEDELPTLCAPLEVAWFRQGWYEDRAVARIVARKV